MKLSDYLIIIVLVGMVITSMYAFEIDLASSPYFTVDIETNYSSTYTKVTQIMKHTNETYDAVIKMTSREDKQFFTGVWDVITLTREMIVDSITLPIDLVVDFTNELGFPSVVVTGLITIITILIIGALIFLAIKRKW
ncbi:MAG TPA: hypothetical protein ENH82_07465 [bacterium]|nr:hypothetical protein [bacterium]